ncbi:MAG TPA: hypothetical protein PLJ21_04340 [Pseudobdellovibrionaceae bacterium]|nr:hypothetical protein [Pseudobdellovibrionaceae bacterium]
MKTNQRSIIKVASILTLTVLLQACGKNEENSGSPGRVGTTAVSVSPTTSCTSTDQMQIGRVYDETNGAMNPTFKEQIKNFISGFADPSDIGDISGLYYDNTRVEFVGSLKFDAQGNIIGQQSQIKMSVYDSKTIYENAAPFNMKLEPAQGMTITGTYNKSNGYVDVQFSDGSGVVTIEAKNDGKFLSGGIKFNNKTSVIGGSAKSGRLGSFYISSCAIL